MYYLDWDDLMAAHEIVAEDAEEGEYGGGDYGKIRDEDVLRFAIERPKTELSGEEKFPGVFLKAACLFEHLASNQGFVDGNKRTAVVATQVFLDMNGWFLDPPDEKIVTFTIDVAEEEKELEEVSSWLENHSSQAGE